MGDLCDLPIGTGVCAHAITSRQALVLEDARLDSRFSSNPVVTEYGLVAYIGVPLITRAGHALGTFCILDPEPRVWQETDLDLMRDLAAMVTTELDLRIGAIELGQRAIEAEDARAEADAAHLNVQELVEGLDAVVWEADLAANKFGT